MGNVLDLLARQRHTQTSGDEGKAHRLEHRFDRALLRRAEFDEFEAVETDGVFEDIGHCVALAVNGYV